MISVANSDMLETTLWNREMKNNILFAQDAKGFCHILTSEEDGEHGGYAWFKSIKGKDGKPDFWVRIKIQKVNGNLFEVAKDGNALYRLTEKCQMRHYIKVKNKEGKESIISFDKEAEFSTKELLVDKNGIRYAVVHLDSGRIEFRQVWRD